MQTLNVLPNETELRYSEERLKNWPISECKELLVEMGRQCNVRCIMCCQTDFDPASKQAEEVWREKLRPAYEHATELTISGGEATVLPGARALLKTIMAEYPQIKLNCITNGVLFVGIWQDAFVKQGGIVNVSLNAIDPDVYSTVVQFGRQKAVIDNIDRLVKAKQEAGSTVKVRISTVILDETVHEMARFIQWAADHHLDQAVLNRNQLGEITKYKPKEVQQFVREAYEASDRNPQVEIQSLNEFDWIFATRNGLEPVRPRTVFQQKVEPCLTAFHTLLVNPHGWAFPCCRTWYYFGNLVEQSLEEVWNGKLAYKFRRRMAGLDFRDCRLDCEYNAKPIPYKIAQMRKAYWVYRRDPKVGLQKTLRIFGFTKPQVELSDEESRRLASLNSGTGAVKKKVVKTATGLPMLQKAEDSCSTDCSK